MFEKENKILEKLKSFECFHNMDYDNLKLMIEYSSKLSYKKDKTIYYQGDYATKLYLIIAGGVKQLKYRCDSTTISLGIKKEGNWLGLTECLFVSKYQTDAVTLGETILLSFLVANINIISKRIRLSDIFMKELLNENYILHSHIEAYTPFQRMLRYIIAKAENIPEYDLQTRNHYIKITQDKLAEISGTTRETINRYLKDLQTRDLVRIHRGKIELIDFESIKNYLGLTER